MEGQAGLKKWGVLVVVCLAIFIMVIDTTIMNVSISALVVELDTTVPAIQSVIAIYALIMASFMLFGSRMQDVMGRKRAFLFGVVLYGIGTFVASMSWNIGVLLVGWSVFEGVGAVFMMPATATFLTAAYSGRDRAVAFGVWGGVAAAGAAFGPIIGGYLTSFYSWRWAFRLELLVVVVILLASVLLSGSKPTEKFRNLDFVGMALSSAGLFLIVIGILQLKNLGVWRVIPFFIGGGLLLLAIFFWWERRVRQAGGVPLVETSLLGDRMFLVGNLVGSLQTAVFAGFLFIIPVFLQSVTGIGAFETGIALLPISMAVFIVSIGGARFSAVIDSKYLVLIGMALGIWGTVMLRDIFSVETTAEMIVPGSVVFGVGMGLVLSQITNLTLSAAPEEEQTDASGVLNTTKQLGTSVGTALIGVVLLISVFSGLLAAVDASGYFEGMEREEIAGEIDRWVEKMETGTPEEIPTPVLAEAERVADASISQAMKSSFDAILALLFIGFFASFLIPQVRREGGRVR